MFWVIYEIARRNIQMFAPHASTTKHHILLWHPTRIFFCAHSMLGQHCADVDTRECQQFCNEILIARCDDMWPTDPLGARVAYTIDGSLTDFVAWRSRISMQYSSVSGKDGLRPQRAHDGGFHFLLVCSDAVQKWQPHRGHSVGAGHPQCN